MTTTLPNLADAEWLNAPTVRSIFAALIKDGNSVRIVGGAVRNALLGLAVADIDFATTATPDVVAALAREKGLKVVPTGVEHGTVTLVAGRAGYQVTTLREDVETDGRHAVVRFGADWEADARRRDFTMNALSVDADGRVYDPLGGYPDLMAGRVRFIGDADRRIAEDRLRILRFFRFHATYGQGDLDRAGLGAAIRAREGVRTLSAERIGEEMRRLLVASRAIEAVTAMQEAGILGIVLGGVGYLGTFSRLAAFGIAVGAPPNAALRFAALGCRIEEDVSRLTDRLRLANAERDRMIAALAAASRFSELPNDRAARRLLYRLGPEAFRDGVMLTLSFSQAAPADPTWSELYRLPERWQAPRFPLSGKDVIGEGAERGPAVGALLNGLEDWWVEQDFAPAETVLRARLQQMIAASQ